MEWFTTTVDQELIGWELPLHFLCLPIKQSLKNPMSRCHVIFLHTKCRHVVLQHFNTSNLFFWVYITSKELTSIFVQHTNAQCDGLIWSSFASNCVYYIISSAVTSSCYVKMSSCYVEIAHIGTTSSHCVEILGYGIINNYCNPV